MNTQYVIKPGDVGIAVNKIQAYLNLFQERGMIMTKLTPDGKYGAKTQQAVREFQFYAKMTPDGVIGKDTRDAIFATLKSLNVVTNIPVFSPTYFLKTGDQGLSVFGMQEFLNEIAEDNRCLRPLAVDGNFNDRMRITVEQFQYLYDLKIDGTIGKATWDAIVNVRNQLP